MDSGASGICFLEMVLRESSIHIDRIERRDEKGNRNERPRDQQKATAYVESLKQLLTKLAINGT